MGKQIYMFVTLNLMHEYGRTEEAREIVMLNGVKEIVNGDTEEALQYVVVDD